MKKKMVWGGLFLAAALTLAPAVTAEAKEVAAGESIPLTEEYFPDEWFLSRAKTYDKNADGFLSPEEVAAVTRLECWQDISDFSQVQYFSNLKILELKNDVDDEYGSYDTYGVWAGSILDLTVFPNLETVTIGIDSGKAPENSSKVQIKVSGLKNLKKLSVFDTLSEDACDGSNVSIDTIDLRDTPALETVAVIDARGVFFDKTAHIKDLYMSNIGQLPLEQIYGLTTLESLSINNHAPKLTALDLSKNISLTTLELVNNCMEELEIIGTAQLESVFIKGDALTACEVSKNPGLKSLDMKCQQLGNITFAGADALETVWIESDVLSDIDVSQNPNIKSLRLDCPKLEKLDVSQNKKLQKLRLDACTGLTDLNVEGAVNLTDLDVRSDRLTELNLTSNTALTDLVICGNKIASLNVTKNTKLTSLHIESKAIKKLNLKKNTKLTRLGIVCKQLASVDLSKNKKLQRLHIYSTLIKSIDLSNQKDLDYLNIRMKKLKSLDLLNLSSKGSLTTLEISDSAWKTIDLSEMTKLKKLTLENNKALSKLDLSKNIRLKELEIHGSPKLTKLDLRKNKRLFDVNVSGNGLKVLDLSGTKKYLTYLDCRDNQLTEIDLSGVSPSYHTAIYCDKNVKVKGYKGEVMH